MQYRVKSIGLVMFLLIFVGAGVFFLRKAGAQTAIYKIGSRGPAGGWIFYDKGNNSDGWRYLETAPEDQRRSKWGCYKKDIPGARGTAIGDGKKNTAAILEGCEESGIAARVARAYRGGSKTDWFLPSKDELHLMYINLHREGIGGFTADYYLSSSEFDANSAWLQYFDHGGQEDTPKNGTVRIRPIRVF